MSYTTELYPVLSQEIRTQMNSIVGLSFLIEGNSEGNIRNDGYSEMIYSICNRLIGIFENIMRTEIEENLNLNLHLEKCNLKHFAGNIFNRVLDSLPRNHKVKARIKIENDCTDNIDFLIDSAKVERAVYSLLWSNFIMSQDDRLVAGCFNSDKELTFYTLDSKADYKMLNDFFNSETMVEGLESFIDTSALIHLLLAKKNVELLGGKIHINPYSFNGAAIYLVAPIVKK